MAPRNPCMAGPAASWPRPGGDSGPDKKGPIRIAGTEPSNSALADRRSTLAYDEIREGQWCLPAHAATIDKSDFYAQVKAPSRVRDLTSGDLKYRWTETGALDFYRYAHAFDHLYGGYRGSPGICVVI